MPNHVTLRAVLFFIQSFMLCGFSLGQSRVSDGDLLFTSPRSNQWSTIDHVFSSVGPERGSPWFSPVWLRGQIDFSDGVSIPQPGEVLYLNYNKSSNQLYCKSRDSIIALNGPEITAFRLNDSIGTHSFVKLPAVSRTAFFEELTDDRHGFTLYRKRLSHLRSGTAPDDTGNLEKSSAFYQDDSEYYLIFPDNKKILRFYLSSGRLRKKLSGVNGVAEKFLREHPGRLTHRMLLRFCDVLNEENVAP